MNTTIKRTVFVLAVTLGGLAHGAVTATPAEVRISSPKQKLEIAVTDAGKPVPAAAITGYTFNVDEHTYEFMITFEKANGKVIIGPSERAESGEYLLTIKTKAGDASVHVKMPLDEDPNSIESQAEALGITVQELMAQRGLSKPVGRETVDFKFPESYHVGDKINITVPCATDRTYECKFNGEVIRTGAGPEKFEYTFTAPGEYLFEYKEYRDRAPIAIGSGKTTVYEKPETVKN